MKFEYNPARAPSLVDQRDRHAPESIFVASKSENGNGYSNSDFDQQINREDEMIGNEDAKTVQEGRPDLYQPELFVNRKRELELIEEKVEQGRLKIPISEPLVNFWGVGGNGKTWLLRHIQHIYCYNGNQSATIDKPTLPIYYDFQRAEAEAAERLDLFVASYTHRVQEEIEEQLPVAATPQALTETEETPEALVNILLTLSEKYVPLLLFDTTERIAADLWTQLEQNIFEPLLDSERVLIILSGRHRAPRWRRVDVRRRATTTAAGHVQPFTKPMQQEQLLKLGLDPAEAKGVVQTIYPLSGGNPYLARRLATTPEEPLPILEAYLSDVLATIPQELHLYLQKVAPLRFYRLEAVRFMLEADTESEKKYPDVRLLQILRHLESETDVVWWDNGRNAYVTAPVVRRVLNQVLRLENESQFRRLHQQALAMYWELTARYPENSPVYLAEICFHQAILDRLQETPPAQLTDFQRVLNQAKTLSLDKRMILPRRIAEDTELADLLPAEQYRQIKTELQELLS